MSKKQAAKRASCFLVTLVNFTRLHDIIFQKIVLFLATVGEEISR
jgi:hypothetical protein